MKSQVFESMVICVLLSAVMIVGALQIQKGSWERRVAALQQTQGDALASALRQERETMQRLVREHAAEIEVIQTKYAHALAARDAEVKTLAWELRQARTVHVSEPVLATVF